MKACIIRVLLACINESVGVVSWSAQSHS